MRATQVGEGDPIATSPMRLSGACSNRRQLAVVRKAAEARSKLTISEVPESRGQPPRLRAGAIQECVIEVLCDQRTTLTAPEIRGRVENRLSAPISGDTVSSFLSVASRSKKWPVERAGYGHYRITPEPR